MSKPHFYCQRLTGEVGFSIADWNELYNMVKGMGLSEAEERKILDGPTEPCDKQCFDCMAIVGEQQAKTKSLP